MRVPMITQLLAVVLRLFRVSTTEELVKRAVRLAFWLALLIPLVILPVFFLLYSALGLR